MEILIQVFSRSFTHVVWDSILLRLGDLVHIVPRIKPVRATHSAQPSSVASTWWEGMLLFLLLNKDLVIENMCDGMASTSLRE